MRKSEGGTKGLGSGGMKTQYPKTHEKWVVMMKMGACETTHPLHRPFSDPLLADIAVNESGYGRLLVLMSTGR